MNRSFYLFIFFNSYEDIDTDNTYLVARARLSCGFKATLGSNSSSWQVKACHEFAPCLSLSFRKDTDRQGHRSWLCQSINRRINIHTGLASHYSRPSVKVSTGFCHLVPKMSKCIKMPPAYFFKNSEDHSGKEADVTYFCLREGRMRRWVKTIRGLRHLEATTSALSQNKFWHSALPG